MKPKSTPDSTFCVLPAQGEGRLPQTMPLAFFFLLTFADLLFKVRIEPCLSSLLKYFEDSCQTPLNRTKSRFVNRIRSSGPFEESPWISMWFVSCRRGTEFLFCAIKPVWLWRASAALVSQFCSFFYSQRKKKKIQLLNSLNEVYLPLFERK